MFWELTPSVKVTLPDAPVLALNAPAV